MYHDSATSPLWSLNILWILLTFCERPWVHLVGFWETAVSVLVDMQVGWDNVRLNFQELRYVLSNTQLTSELPHRRQNLLPR